MSGATFRFAPSPNGRLHLGHAYSALLNEAMARRLGGRLLLRIEDIDPVRSRLDLIHAVEEDLAWLGVAFDGQALRQSDRMDAYRDAADRLRSRALLYPCFCSRSEVAAAAAERPATRDPDGSPVYPGTCRALPAGEAARRIGSGEPHAWRLDVQAAMAGLGPLSWRRVDVEGVTGTVSARPERWGDAVLVRKDVAASYHLAVAVDDAAQAITHVVRGAELEAATDLHALVAARLGLPSPGYHHHRLIRDETGAKLAKSRGSTSLRSLREEGWTAADIRSRLGFGPEARGPAA